MKSLQLPAGGNQIVVSDSVITLEEALRVALSDTSYKLPPAADAIVLAPEGANIRILYDGNDPAADAGIVIFANTVSLLEDVDLSRLKMIRVAGVNVDVSIQIGETKKSYN